MQITELFLLIWEWDVYPSWPVNVETNLVMDI